MVGRPRKQPDEWVPDEIVRQELGGISTMSLWRYDHDPHMAAKGWPPPKRLTPMGRKYRSRRQLEKFKQSVGAAAE
jgi:hypothetical protein